VLCLLETEFVDLVAQLLLCRDELLPKHFDVRIFLLELSLSLLSDLLLDAEYFLQNVNVLMERAGYLLVLFQFFAQEYFDALQSF